MAGPVGQNENDGLGLEPSDMFRRTLLGCFGVLAFAAGMAANAQGASKSVTASDPTDVLSAIAAVTHSTMAAYTIEDAFASSASQNGKKDKYRAKKPPKKNPREPEVRAVPEIDAKSGGQAIALIFGMLLLAAERLRRHA
jgi:hypothetical protein